MKNWYFVFSAEEVRRETELRTLNTTKGDGDDNKKGILYTVHVPKERENDAYS